MNENEFVSTKDLAKIYEIGGDKVTALAPCNITIGRCEQVAIMGPSGSGKSTLLSILGGISQPTAGNAFIKGENITNMKEKQLAIFRRKNIGFVFQGYNLIPEMTAKQNIILPLLLDGKKVDKSYFQSVCDTLKISDRLHHLPGELSGGQQQRVAIARALINKPSLLLCDEPTGNLDSVSGDEVLSLLLKTCGEFSCTLVTVTHDKKIAEKMQRILYIRDGVVSENED